MDRFLHICYLSHICTGGFQMNEQDSRVIKSKKAIRDALFTILDTKPINKITIKEVAEAANINFSAVLQEALKQRLQIN